MKGLNKADWLSLTLALIGCILSVGSALYGHHGWVSDLGAIALAVGVFVAFFGFVGRIQKSRRGKNDGK